MANDEIRMTNSYARFQFVTSASLFEPCDFPLRHSSGIRHSSFVIRHEFLL